MIGLEYRNQNTLRAYPLGANQDIPGYIKACLVDAYFQLPYGSNALPVLTSFSVYEEGQLYSDTRDTTFRISLEVKDKTTENTLINVENVVIWRRFSGEHGGSYYSSDKFSCIVLHGPGLYEYVRDIPDRLEASWTGELTFDSHCIEYDTQNVTSITFKNEDGTTVYSTKWQSDTYQMGFLCYGEDVDVTVENDDANLIGDNSGLLYGLVDGTVRIDVSEPAKDDRVDAKNTLAIVSGSSCIDVITNPDNRSIVILNKCVACCSCEQYKDKVNEVTALANKIAGMRSDLHSAVDTYNDLVRRLNSSSSTEDLFSITVTANGYNPSTQHIFSDPVMTCNATIVNNNCHDVFWKCLGFRVTGRHTHESWAEMSNSTMWYLRTKDPTKTNYGIGWPSLIIPSGCSLSVTSRFTTGDRSIIPPPAGAWSGTVVCMGTFDTTSTEESPEASGYLTVKTDEDSLPPDAHIN